jgi:hypothetical protein
VHSVDDLEPKRQPGPSYRRRYSLLEHGLDPFLAYLLKKVFPICSCLWDALMHPQSVNLAIEGRSSAFFISTPSGSSSASSSESGLKPNRSLQSPENDDASGFIDSQPHAIDYAICHSGYVGTGENYFASEMFACGQNQDADKISRLATLPSAMI